MVNAQTNAEPAMAGAAFAAAGPVDAPLPDTDAAAGMSLLRTMLLARLADERLIRLYKQGAIQGGVYCGIGQEAIGAATTTASRPEDLFAPLIRNMAVHVGRGETPLSIFRQWLARAQSPTKGRDGNIHYGTLRHGVYPMISHLGAMIPVVVGGIMARRRRGEATVGFAYIGDGGTSTGDFHEGLNFAAVFDVPLIMIVENNKYAYSTPTARQYRCARLVDRAPGYGIEGHSADGNDALALYRLVAALAEDLRTRPRPVMIECDTLRMRGHGEHDDFTYVPAELLETYRARDPIAVATSHLMAEGLATAAAIEALTADCRQAIDQAYQQAMSEPPPNPETLSVGVYADA